MTDPSPSVLTPCIGVCRINDDKVCVGCWRTLDEIAAWSALDDSSRHRLMAKIADRKRSMQDQSR